MQIRLSKENEKRVKDAAKETRRTPTVEANVRLESTFHKQPAKKAK